MKPKSNEELDAEIQRLKAAIAYLANCVGAHILSAEDGKKLAELLK